MKTLIEPLEDGNTRIRIPIEFRYDNGRKRIYFPEMPDAHLQINESLATGIARAYRWLSCWTMENMIPPKPWLKHWEFTLPMSADFCALQCSLHQS